ncbi:AI-2E family transporter [Millisia brevis]|uniref:AI-2E family transporter n=1 Tax=Millisia brevis TaxID=264148 RepID=UPI000A03DE42|nr:AI-2E family transporter [Millisia brevis]
MADPQPEPSDAEPMPDRTGAGPGVDPLAPHHFGPAHPVERIDLGARTIWRAGWVLAAVVACVLGLWFLLMQGGGTIFVLIVSAFLAVAMEPAVVWVSRWVRRRVLATAIVFVTILAVLSGFLTAFGGLLVSEVATLSQSVPSAVNSAVAWVNNVFHTSYDVNNLFTNLNVTPDRVASYAAQLSGGAFQVLGDIVGGVFHAFAILLFTLYISASMPALRGWFAGLFPPARQEVVLTVWEVFVTKVGGYVTARVILAIFSATAHGIFMLAVGMPYWIALGLWFGLVSQFVPTIGTYIAVALPAVVGFTSDRPILGILIIAFSVAYQQFENLILDPRISSRAVDVHPGVVFASVLLGAELFGLVGGLLAVPVAATLTTVFEIYKTRYEISPEIDASARSTATRARRRKSGGPADDDRPNPDDRPDPDPADADDPGPTPAAPDQR